ncbi:MAG TPA: TfoX/Sxy family protein [bacterium]|nr:TfoX/Sxy family protein [bacterium]
MAGRVRAILVGQPGLSERRMFGGLAFILHGHMACGIVRDELMVRVGPQEHAEALAQPNARAMDFTGRPMKGMVFVAAEALGGEEALRAWVQRGVAYTGTLPPK